LFYNFLPKCTTIKTELAIANIIRVLSLYSEVAIKRASSFFWLIINGKSKEKSHSKIIIDSYSCRKYAALKYTFRMKKY
jgi:hypothetical protein